MVNVRFILVLVIAAIPHALVAEDLGEMWGTAREEEKYYPIVNIPIPPEVPMRPGSFEILPDGRLAVGTRRGDIYFIKGAFQSPPSRSTTSLPVGRTRSSDSPGKTER